MKKTIKNTAVNYDIDLICDLHGHSRKKNIFMYGCNFPKSPQTCKLFPYILAKISPVFSYDYSRFGVQKTKESTMRVSLFKEMKIPNIFTLEASFCGADTGKYDNMHFSGEILAEMGRDLCRAVLILSQNSSLARNPALRRLSLKQKQRKNKTQDEETEIVIITEHNIEAILTELLARKDSLQAGEGNASSSGSESEPSEDNLEFQELKSLMPATHSHSLVNSLNFNKNALNRGNFYRNKTLTKKCGKCGEEDLHGHFCKIFEVTAQRRKIVGIRTYYNITGKRVHDQETQTPPSFYEKTPKKTYVNSLNTSNFDRYETSSNFSANEDLPGVNEFSNKISHLPSLNIHRNSFSDSTRFLDNSKRLK